MSLQTLLAKVKLWDGTNTAAVTASNQLKVDASGVAVPVTDNSGTLSVDDGAGSLTVDNGGTFAVQAAQSGTWTVQPGNTANTTAWKVDASSVAIPVTDNSGTLSIDDGGGSITVDGTVTATASGDHTVVGKAAQDAAVSGNPVLVGARASAASPTDVSTDGDAVALWTTLKGALNVADGGGNLSIDDGGNSITVDNGGTFAVQATIASGATAIAKAEDVASADADVGVPAMAIRKATPANTSGTDGDYEMLQMAAGRLWVDASGKTLTVDPSGVTSPVSLASVPTHAVTQSGTWTVQPGNTANTTAWLVTPAVNATSTITQVASSATNVTLLASNANRKGASIFNDSTQAVYVKFGTTASSTSFTVKMAAASYYEVPFGYTGKIDGIWVSANGNAYVTEITA